MNDFKIKAVKKTLVGLMAATSALLLAACGSPVGSDTVETESAGPKLKVALITHQPPGDTWFDIVRSGAEMAAEVNNIDLLYTSDPEAGRQAQLVEQAIDQGVDGIVLTLAKPEPMSAAVKKAVAAGIPVVGINGGEDDYQEMGAIAHFGQNEYAAGLALGEQLNRLNATRVLCPIQIQGQVGLEQRCQGLADEFEGQSEVIYVQGTDMTNVSSTITSKLQTNPDIDFVVTLGAPFAMTALDAIAQANSTARVGTVDLNHDVYEAMQRGEIEFAIDQQPWMQGYEGVEAIRLFSQGGYVLGGGKSVPTGPTAITKDNLKSVAAQFASEANGE